jgi:putative transposase
MSKTSKHPQFTAYIPIYTIQAISKPALERGIIKPSGVGIEIRTRQRNVDQVRIVPKSSGCYVVEVVHTQEEKQEQLDYSRVCAVDIGVNNLVALTSNKRGFVPRLVNGRPIKSVNQCYNKQISKLQRKMSSNHHTSRELEHVAAKRTRRIDHYMHTASRRVIDLLVETGIGTLVIGKNPNWKQESGLRKKDNQHFVQISHARFIDMLTYKARLVGIHVLLQEESYTSKASLLDLDPIPVYGKEGEKKPAFNGKRVTRGMYRSKSGQEINADVNGSGNIMRKALPNVFMAHGIGDVNGIFESLVVHPVRIVVPLRIQRSRKR